MRQLPFFFSKKKVGHNSREGTFNAIEELSTQFSNLQIMELPYFFDECVNFNAREEIFNAIEELSIHFSSFQIQKLLYSIYHHYQYSSTDILSATNITPREIMVVTNNLPETITKMRIDLDVSVHPWHWDGPRNYMVFSEEIRMILSGMTLFRIEVLPIFLNVISDASDKEYLSKAPIFLCAHEEKLKKELLNFIHKGEDLGQEEERRNKFPPSHLWWNAKQFVEMEGCVDAIVEYMLED